MAGLEGGHKAELHKAQQEGTQVAAEDRREVDHDDAGPNHDRAVRDEHDAGDEIRDAVHAGGHDEEA